MSDEEKKAIEYVKNIKSWWWDNSPNRIYSINRTDIEQFDIVLNLTERQQKEIEEFKEKNKKYTIHFTDKQYEDAIKLAQSVVISMFEDKIKAKTIEIKNRPVKDEFITASQGKLNTIIDVESLLEKE